MQRQARGQSLPLSRYQNVPCPATRVSASARSRCASSAFELLVLGRRKIHARIDAAPATS